MISREQMKDFFQRYLYQWCLEGIAKFGEQEFEYVFDSWFEFFKDLNVEVEDIESAFKGLLATYTGERFPSPGDLMKRLATNVKYKLPSFDYVYRIVDRCSFTKEAFEKFPKFVKYIIVGPSNLKVWANTDYNFWVTEGKQNYERFTSIENISTMILDGKMGELKEMYVN